MTSRFGGAVGGGQGSKFGGVQISEQENIQAEIDAAQESKPISALDQALGASPTIASGAVGGARQSQLANARQHSAVGYCAGGGR